MRNTIRNAKANNRCAIKLIRCQETVFFMGLDRWERDVLDFFWSAKPINLR